MKHGHARQGETRVGAMLALVLLLASCTTRPTFFTPQQVIDSKEPEEAHTISKLEEQGRYFRKILVSLMKEGQIEEADADNISAKLRAVDYYICKGWVAMIEGDVRLRDESILFIEAGLGVIQAKLFEVIKGVKETGERV